MAGVFRGAAPRPSGSPRGIWSNKKGLWAALLLAGLPGVAGASCLFGTECLEGEPCAESAFEVDVIWSDGEVVTLSTEFGDFQAMPPYYAEDGVTQIYHARSGATAYTMSVAEGGAARMSVLMGDAPMAITYLGRCEGEQ